MYDILVNGPTQGAKKFCHRAVVLGVVAALASFIALSFVMQLFWHNYRSSEPLPNVTGYDEFLSATWGDAIFIPLSVGSATYLINSLDQAPKEKRYGICAAAVGTALGALPQVVSLLDDNPRLNWTFLQPHTFTAAGYYHMTLSILGSGLCGYAAAVLAMRAVANRYRKLGQLIALGILFTSSSIFLALAGLDAQKSARNQFSVLLPIVGGWLAMSGLIFFPFLIKGERRDGKPQTDGSV